jgi:ABC-type multidrug transport system ATPase subunit
MGASGAGKTSLLNALCDRISLKRGCTLKGDLMLNDEVKLTQSAFGNVGSYVMQDDILFIHFTPREALRFAARLKLKIPIS